MAAFEIKKGDRLPAIESTLTDAAGAAIDLTNATAVFAFRLNSGGAVKTGAATVTDAAAGKVKYSWAAGDTDTVGVYAAEWRLTFTGGVEMTVPSSGFLYFTISDDLG